MFVFFLQRLGLVKLFLFNLFPEAESLKFLLADSFAFVGFTTSPNKHYQIIIFD